MRTGASVPLIQRLPLMLVTDRALAGPRALPDLVGEAVAGGVTCVQLRDKEGSTRDMVVLGRALKALLDPRDIPLLINDRIDVCQACGADGVHLGQSDMPLPIARRILGTGAIIGLSITDPRQMKGSDVEMADYLGVGPIFATLTKPDADPPLGLAGLAGIRAVTGKPVVAIGGITAAQAPGLRSAGADGIAVVSAVLTAREPRAAAQALKRAFLAPTSRG